MEPSAIRHTVRLKHRTSIGQYTQAIQRAPGFVQAGGSRLSDDRVTGTPPAVRVPAFTVGRPEFPVSCQIRSPPDGFRHFRTDLVRHFQVRLGSGMMTRFHSLLRGCKIACTAGIKEFVILEPGWNLG